MAGDNSHSILAAGLPSSGKTTFLAALYAVLESGEVATNLKLERSGDNDAHLNKIRATWNQCRPVPRNDPGVRQIVPLSIVNSKGTQKVQLMFPDLNGETFRDQWIDRTTTMEQQALAEQSTAVQLFINPDKIVEPWQTRDVQKIEAVLSGISDDENNHLTVAQGRNESRNIQGGENLLAGHTANASVHLESASTDDSGDSPDSESSNPPKLWDAKCAPTQVVLVDILQMAIESLAKGGLQKIAVIVSAWDLVRNLGMSPDAWLADRLPLLHQFLKSNMEMHPYRIYGVSATGGNLDKDREKLLKMRRCDRIIVSGPDIHNEHDITEPIRWLIS